MKNKSIYKKILFPIVQMFLLFIILSFVVQYFYIDKYVKNSAKEKVSQIYTSLNENLKNSENNQQKLKNLIKDSNGTSIYVYDEELEEILKVGNNGNEELSNFIKELLFNFELEEGAITLVRFDKKEYLARMYENYSLNNNKNQYYIIIQELTEKSIFIKEALKDLIIIYIILLILVLITVAIIARQISKPIIKLANESEKFVVGNEPTITREKINIEEVETLKKSIISMQERINEDDKKQKKTYENISHDLRTPLVSIIGYADALRTGILKDNKKAGDVIFNTGNQLKEMVENILILSRLDNGTYKEKKEKINIFELLQQQIELLNIIDTKKEIDVDIKNEKNIITDKRLLTRIIQNLLANAIKYSEKKVSIKVYEENEKYFIEVFNDGKEIQKEDLEHLFDRYYKGQNGNNGIGLNVVKMAADFIGININVKSQKNEGTYFILGFPKGHIENNEVVLGAF